MSVFAIDPGSTESGWVHMASTGRLLGFGKADNESILLPLSEGRHSAVCIEKVASYGMPVGAEVFDTCVWIGRFVQAAQPSPVTLLTRKQVASHLCGGGEREKNKSPNDATVRRALMDRYGGDASIRKGGMLHGVVKDTWSALALGCAYLDGVKEK